CDLSTGFFQIDEFDEERAERELIRIDPSEILVAEEEKKTLEKIIQNLSRTVAISYYDSWKFSYENASKAVKEHFEVISVEGFGFDRMKSAICAAGALLLYLKEQKKNELRHITKITSAKKTEYAELDPSTVRNLELLKPLFSDDKEGTLINVLDATGTPMGSRLLKQWLLRPLLNKKEIENRLDCVELFKKESFIRGEIELLLRNIADIERLIGKITYERANARDVVALKKSLAVFPKIIKVLSSVKNEMILSLCVELNDFETLVKEVERTIVDDPPLSIKEGGIIKNGVSSELDEIKNAALNGKKWIAELQERERNRTGIPSLKVGFNKVFGYYIEVSNAHLSS
ncbi:MAG: hypothetical protein N2053_02005, partial [Chitinispirillaceae bacterium]|nr:hypothetical protein [Chitinispirillaceae bacterium]